MFVFVYGTLKEGHGNNRLLRGCELVGQAIIRDHELRNCGFPIAVKSNTSSALGEVWKIPEDILSSTVANLDRLEGYRAHDPRSSMYTRETTQASLCSSLEDLEASEKVLVHYYLANPEYWDTHNHRLCQQPEENLYEWNSSW